MRFTCKIIILSFILTLPSFAREHLIYSIDEEIPMGYENEKPKRNYYVNIGSNQGVKAGTTLDVFRVISKSNPYDNLKRINYKVKIGELEVLHSDDHAAIGSLKKIKVGIKDPLFEISSFMIGDYVGVSVKD